MRGSVRRNGKAWQFVFDAPKGPQGRRNQVTRSGFSTKKAAEAALREAIRQLAADPLIHDQPASPATGMWMRDSWLPAHGRTLRPSTRASYEAIIRSHISSDAIARIELAALTAEMIELFLERLASKPGRASGSTLGGKTLRHVHQVLSVAFKEAINRGLMTANPLDSVPKPRVTKPEIKVWTAAEMGRFFDSASHRSPRLTPLYRLASVTGMRRGELAGLQWRHVDFNGRTVRIEQVRLHVAGAIVLGEPKTDTSRRTITLRPQGLSALQQSQLLQETDAAALGDDWIDSAYVFTKPTGDPLHPDYITKRFRRDSVDAGVAHIRLHGLRHTFATTALALGENPKSVSEILGHANIQTTLDLYSQYLPGAHAATVEAVESALFGLNIDPTVTNPVINDDGSVQTQSPDAPESPYDERDSDSSGGGI